LKGKLQQLLALALSGAGESSQFLLALQVEGAVAFHFVQSLCLSLSLQLFEEGEHYLRSHQVALALVMQRDQLTVLGDLTNSLIVLYRQLLELLEQFVPLIYEHAYFVLQLGLVPLVNGRLVPAFLD